MKKWHKWSANASDIHRKFNGRVPKIVVLCGSTRFTDEFRKQTVRLTLENCIVLSIGINTLNSWDLDYADEFGLQIVMDNLVELHKRKIDLADEVLVLNVGGHIGDHTADEIAYALWRGKPVVYLEEKQ